MNHNKIFVFLTMSIHFMFPCCQAITEIPTDCANGTMVSAVNLIAYEQWPFRLSCNAFEGEEAWYDWLYYEAAEFELVNCVVVNESGILSHINASSSDIEEGIGYLFIPETGVNTTLNFTLVLSSSNGSSCIVGDVHINVIELKEINCPSYVENQEENSARRREIGSAQSLSCDQTKEDMPRVVEESGITYQWFYNCSTDLPAGIQFSSDNKSIEIDSVNFQHAGSYQCAVVYRNMTRFILNGVLCIAHPITFNEQALECDETVLRLNIGENKILRCSALFGEGGLPSQRVNVLLKKYDNGNVTDEVKCTEYGSTLMVGNVQCSFNNPSNTCYDTIPSIEEQKIPLAKVTILIHFRGIVEENYGTYNLQSFSTLQTIPNQNETFILVANQEPVLLSQVAIAGICIGVIIFVFILVGIFLYFSIYIRVYYRRYFGPAVPDDKQYGAMLVYHFSTNSNIYAQNDIRNSAPKIRKLLERKGYKIYEEGRNGPAGNNRPADICASIQNSHRVIIFLNSEFDKDDWSRSTLSEGFTDMIKHESKLIFILFPGIMAFLKQRAKEDNYFKSVLTAVKINYAIKLPKNFQDRRFKFQLENAMPKLKQETRSPKFSTICNDDDFEDKANGFEIGITNKAYSSDCNAPADARDMADQQRESKKKEESTSF